MIFQTIAYLGSLWVRDDGCVSDGGPWREPTLEDYEAMLR